MIKQEKLTAKAATLYILEKDPLYKKRLYRVYNILYFANMLHLEKCGSNVVEDDFYALSLGPYPQYIADNIKEFIKSDEKFNDLDLSESNKKCLDNCYICLLSLSDLELIEHAKDYAYVAARERENKLISFEDIVMSLNASDDMKQYITENYIVRKELLNLKKSINED